VNARDPKGDTALHLAAKEPVVDSLLIRHLLDAGAYVDAVNKDGQTMEELVPCHVREIVNPLKYRSLATIAARCLARNTLPEYYMSQLPRTLLPMVLEH